MALPTLSWKRIGPYATGGINTVEAWLDALDDMLTNDDYFDAETRTPGSGSAWTHAIYENATVTEALYLTPPAAAVSDFRVILAGVDSGAPTPTMEEDPFATGMVMCGMNKGSGSFNAWDNALPFTSGVFSGYNNFADVDLGGRTVDFIHVIESQEAIAIFSEFNDGGLQGCVLGAITDPMSTAHKDAESNGRIYTFAVSGAATPNLGIGANGFLNNDSGFNNSVHTRTWAPHTNETGRSGLRGLSGTANNQLILKSGKRILYPAPLFPITGNIPDGPIARGIHITLNDRPMTTIQSGGTNFGHFVGNDTDMDGQCWLFLE